MSEKTYNTLLTVLIMVIVVTLVIGGGVLIHRAVQDKKTVENSDDAVQALEEELAKLPRISGDTRKNENAEVGSGDYVAERVDTSGNSAEGVLSKKIDLKMGGFNVVGILEIPKINLKYNILEGVTKKSLEMSVAMFETSRGINREGNTTIMGHNYRNRMFFSKLDQLKNGDTIKVTGMDGEVVTYEIYDMDYKMPNDASYMRRDTNGAREVSLSTCNDDSSERLVVLARER